MAFLRIRVLNKTSLGDARLIPPAFPLLLRDLLISLLAARGPSLVRPTCIRLAHTIWFPWYLIPVPPTRPSYVVLVVVVVVVGRHRVSLRVGDREANRKGVHHCRRLRSGRQHAVLADEKNRTRTRERKGHEGELRGDRGRNEGKGGDPARCASHSAILFRLVFTEVNVSIHVRIDMNRISRHAIRERALT